MKRDKLLYLLLFTLFFLPAIACSFGNASDAAVPTTASESASPSVEKQVPEKSVVPTAAEPPGEPPVPGGASILDAGAADIMEELPGSYTFSREIPDGTSQRGSLKVTGSGIGFRFDWAGTTSGLALVIGSSVAVSSHEDCGVVFYDIYPDRSMSAMWLDWGDSHPGTEFLEPASAMQGKEITGRYIIEGYNPDGSDYGGTVEIKKLGDAFDVYWETGGGTSNFEGIGIIRDQRLAVSYGDSSCAVYHYQVRDDGSLEGVIGFPGGKTGTEIAAPE